jgi:photosystem II stability/assembly factor-like uncharacterized protein
MVAVAVSPNFAQDHTLFASTGQLSFKPGIYAMLKSSDGGVDWSVVAGLPNNGETTSIAFSPAYALDETVATATGGGLFLSTDQGNSWIIALHGSVATTVFSPNYAADGTLFAVTSQASVMRSTDRGQTWSALPLPVLSGIGPTILAVSPTYAVDGTLLLGTCNDGIFLSTDSGNSWLSVASGLTRSPVTGLAFSPSFQNDGTAFAATNGSGVLISTTAATSWTFSNTGIGDLNVTSLTLSPGYLVDSTVWVTSAVGGVSRSINQGISWSAAATVSRKLSPLTTTHYQAIAAAGGPGALLYLATYEGLWTTNNGASSWLYIDTLPTRLVRHINISPNFAQDKTIFASTYGGGNVWSSSGGKSWIIRNTGMQSPYTDASAFSPNFAVDGTAFSSNLNGLQRTTNSGNTWQMMNGLGTPVYPRAVAVSPDFAQDATVLIGISAISGSPGLGSCWPSQSNTTGLFRSIDGGNTWDSTSLSGLTGINSIAMSPAFATDLTAFAASPNTGLYVSANGGSTWTRVTSVPSGKLAIVAMSPSFSTDGTVFTAGTTAGVYKSTDRGATWTTVAGTNTLRVLDLQVSPNYANDQSFYAGTMQKGLVKFSKGGATMLLVKSFPDQFVSAIGVSPNLAADHTLFAAGYHAMYKTTNGGTSWTRLSIPARIEETQNVNGPLEEPPVITFQGSWDEVTPSTSASTNGFMNSSASQTSLVLNFMGTGVSWVAWTGPGQGSATVELDGVPQTISLTAPTKQPQQLVWQQTGLLCGLHSVTITGPLYSGLSVSLDAFNVWVDNCPLQ